MALTGLRYCQELHRRLIGGKRLTIVMYHSISPQPSEFAISPAAFARQIDFLARHYPIVRLSAGRAELASHVTDQRHVVITFDDAFRNFIDFAYPVLRRHSIPCSVFVPTRYIGRTNEWDLHDARSPQEPLMSAEEILDLHRDGLVEFGSHSVDHVSMASLPYKEMIHQAVESKRVLETLLGASISTFAYPYGQLDNYSDLSTSALTEAGYKAAVTTHWGTLNTAGNPLALRRIHFTEGDDASVLRGKVEGDHDWIAAKERTGFAIRSVRRRVTSQ